MIKTFFSTIFVLVFSLSTFSQIQDQKAPDCAVQLKIEFLDSGQIGNISLFKSSCNDKNLEQNAIDAAKKIKFDPQKKDGKKITVTKTVEYTFFLDGDSKTDEKAEAVLKKAVEKLGGDNYLNVKSIVGRGKFSVLSGGTAVSYQSFTDVLVYPDKERTEFKQSGVKTVQTNVGETGWIFDGAAETIGVQNKAQIENFKRGVRVSLDNLLRGYWRGKATLSYAGKRPASLGKRSEAVKLTFEDGFVVEFEFTDEYFPLKAIYKRNNADNEEIKEEDRYAQFVDISGIKTPFIVDHFTNGQQTSRINYETIEFNKTIPEAIFTKPNSPKELKKDLKL